MTNLNVDRKKGCTIFSAFLCFSKFVKVSPEIVKNSEISKLCTRKL